MYFTDRGIEELASRRGDEDVTLAWLADRLSEFVDYTREAVGPDVEIETSLLEELDPGPGGKFRPARSLIAGRHQAPDWDAMAP